MRLLIACALLVAGVYANCHHECNGYDDFEVRAFSFVAVTACMPACAHARSFARLFVATRSTMSLAENLKSLSIKALTMNAPYSDNTTGTALLWLGD